MPTVRIEIVKSRGNYEAGAQFEIDEQVARQLMADGTARVVSVEAAEQTSAMTDKPKARRQKA